MLTLASNTVASFIDVGPHPIGIAIRPTPLRETSTSVTCSPSSVVLGAPTTCTATVTDIDAGTPVTPSGGVRIDVFPGAWLSANHPCTLSGFGATATCQVTRAPNRVRPHSEYFQPRTITATYLGDSVHAFSVSSTPLAVTTRSTSISLSCNGQPITVGQPTLCTATVTDSSPGAPVTPSGRVSFSGQQYDSFPYGACDLSGSEATATCQVPYIATSLGNGQHTLTATYGGDIGRPRGLQYIGGLHLGSSTQTTVTVQP